MTVWLALNLKCSFLLWGNRKFISISDKINHNANHTFHSAIRFYLYWYCAHVPAKLWE